MPHSSREALLPIKESLLSSLAKGVTPSSLDQRLVSNSKQILMHKIQFRPAEKASHNYQLDSLRAKYTPLNAGSGKCSSPELAKGYKTPESAKMIGESLPAPKVVLFPPEKVNLEWLKMGPSGAGLVNLGNTCFLNSTLQCLTYTAPLVNYLRSEDHCNTCKLAGFCMLCELHRHIKRCFEQAGSIKPLSIVHKLRVIAKHMHLGRQEDAHEFLRYVIDHMQKACLYGYSKLDNFSKETTAINQIFGGYLRSQVVCLKCSSRSNTYDPFLDISLDIKNSPSVVKALERYIHPERLDSDNAYNCTKCRQKVPAQKRFTIHKAPNVLTIQLKRFDCSRPSAKVTRHVHYPEKLDLRPYMSNRNESSVYYQLYAVLVHSGYSCNSGHYYCFVKAPNRIWHCMNDQHVSQIGVNRVLNAEAYLLFYKRVNFSQHIKGAVIGPHLPKSPNLSVPRQTLPLGKTDADVGLPVSRKPLIKTSTVVREGQTSTETLGQSHTIKPGVPLNRPRLHGQSQPPFTPSPIPMPSHRDKISFGMKSKEDSKPRLVMRIKHGTVCYNSSVENRKSSEEEASVMETSKRDKAAINQQSTPWESGAAKSAQKPVYGDGMARPAQKLVPYNGESESDSDDGKLSGRDKQLTNGNKPTSHTVNNLQNMSKSSFEPIIDERLTATMTVPGAYRPLDQATMWMGGKKSRGGFSKDDSHSYVPVNKVRPLNRSLSDDGLTIVTSPLRINATTHWNLLGNDAQVSPSITSGSSNTSINSTTEWHVRSKQKQKGQLVAEAQHVGWKVTPVRTAKQDNNRTTEDSKSNTNESFSTFAKQESSSSLPRDHGRSEESNTNHKMQSSTSDSELATQKHKKKNGFSRLLCLGSDVSCDRGSHHKEKPHDMSVYDFHDDFHDDSNVTSVPIHGLHLKEVDQENQKKTKNQVEKTNKQLITNLPTFYGDMISKLQKKHKKNKKHKKKHKRHHDDSSEPLDSSITDGDLSSSRHKKKKHKKRKYEDLDGEEGVSKKKMRDVEIEEDTSNDQEYTWVEKSKDTSCLIPETQSHHDQVHHTPLHDVSSHHTHHVPLHHSPPHAAQPHHGKTHPTVHIQHWDQHIKDPLKRPSVADDDATKPLSKAPAWDGSRTRNGADVVSELLSSNSRGFGGQVLSWDGGCSAVDEDDDKRKKNNHGWSDEYEEELDRGKVKKVKKHAESNHDNHINMFQSYQDSRNGDKERRKSDFISPERDHHHYDINGNRHKSSYHGYHDRSHGVHQHDGHHRDGYYNKGYSERH